MELRSRLENYGEGTRKNVKGGPRVTAYAGELLTGGWTVRR